jgi:hypothetical protein
MKAIVVLRFGLFMAGIPLFFAACADPSALPGSTSSRVTVTLPAYPPERPELRGWLMVQSTAPPSYLPPTDRDVTVTLEKNRCAPFLFYPLTGTPVGDSSLLSQTSPALSPDELSLRFFAPAGCVYPAGTAATWQDGFASRLCLDLLIHTTPDLSAEQRQAFCMRFNWQRFSREVAALEQAATESRTIETFNPWNLDRQKIITAICAGKFTKTALRVKVIPITVSASEQTAYYQPYVLASPLTTEADGTFAVPYRSDARDNALFDPTAGAVLGIYPQDENYRLAVLPLEHYIWDNEL